ncbi:MAG TPA: histidine kinase, partial [Rhodanobacter sp.]|nr:histidine kinase [Rhodanobacter sp.]
DRQPGKTVATSSPLGKTLAAADSLAMAQLLGEHERLARDVDLSHSWPDAFAPSLLARCQQDLRRHFPAAEKSI